MIEQVHWYTQASCEPLPPLRGHTSADAVVLGGGMAGLSAAQYLREAGLEVVLLEGRFCGAGATGKSSGFITPDSELELHQLTRRFGDADAGVLWAAAGAAVERIRANIDEMGIACERLDDDCLFVARSPRAVSEVRGEHETRRRLGLASRFYDRGDLPEVLGAEGYYAAVRYGGTFSINGYLYAQGLARALAERGVRIFEHSPAVRILPHQVLTPQGSVRARWVVVCLDRFAPDAGIAARDAYHVQTFLAVTEPLDPATLRELFPDRGAMVWDTDLIYHYFRRTADGRLLVGGATLPYTYLPHVAHGEHSAVRGLPAYARRHFPVLQDVAFVHYWPGMLGVSKDLLPLAGPSPRVSSHLYALCCTGLPWSTLAGGLAAQRAVEGPTPLDRFLDPARAFSPLEPLQPLLRKTATFAMSNYYSKLHAVGPPARIARQQRGVRAAMGLTAAAVGVGLAMRLGRRRRPARGATGAR